MATRTNAVFLGSKALGLSILKCLYAATPECTWTIVHPDDHADERSVLEQFRAFASARDLELVVAASGAATKQLIVDRGPDIGFVCGWYWLLDAATIHRVHDGLWGIHNSLLPKYRGGAPLVWSIINGDPVVGSTVFKISAGMDDGPVLHQVKVALGPDQNVSDALALIEDKLVKELPGRWSALLSGQAALTVQREEDATYCGQRTEAHGRIDWHAAALSVHNFVRAQAPPYPGAFSYLNDNTIRILRSRVFPGTYFGTPGQILRRDENSVLVSCGKDTALEVLELTVDGEQKAPSHVAKSVRDRFLDAPNSRTHSRSAG